jgi:sarcosine oxidase subunit delta
MLLIPCPHCGPRAEIEFRYAGEAHLSRRTEDVTDEQWGAYLYARRNERGDRAERWRHIHGCGQFFNVIRNTVSDRIAASYPAGESRPEDRL